MAGCVSRLISGIVLLMLPVACTAADRIDPSLRTLAATGVRLHVLIVLSQQPQRDIVRGVQEAAASERSAARARLQEAIRGPFSLPQDADEARAELDRINLEIRHEAFAEIRQAIQPQQDGVVLLLESYAAANIRRYTAINAISADAPPSILGHWRRTPTSRAFIQLPNFNRS